ncbi:MAG: acylphosphatase [Bdellovibrionota bacterium]|nr:acylphosphatase [Bdellovibrionota bacterium]
MGLVSKFFEVHGKVQNVMFSQTFIRGAIKRHLSGGSTTDPENKGKVLCMLKGEKNVVEDYINFLEQKKVINSWHATVDKIIQSKEEQSLEDYEVTTQNVDNFKWSSDVEMYV